MFKTDCEWKKQGMMSRDPSMMRGFKLPALTLAPGKELITLLVEVREDRIGLLADLSKELAERGFNIVNVVTRTELGMGIVLFVVERVGDERLEDLMEDLSQIRGVGKVTYEKSPVPGLAILTQLFPLTRDWVRIIALSEAGLKALYDNLSSMVGKDACNAVLFRIGYEMGKGFAEGHLRIARSVGIEEPLEVIRHVSVPLYAASGYGLLSMEELEGKIIARVEDNLEALQRLGSREPSCFLTKGIFKGVLERILNRAVSVDEVRCRAAGDDHCEFEVKL